MKPHKILVLLRCKTHELGKTGECIPPAVDDTKDMIFEINASDKAIAELKKDELLAEFKKWLEKLNQQ